MNDGRNGVVFMVTMVESIDKKRWRRMNKKGQRN